MNAICEDRPLIRRFHWMIISFLLCRRSSTTPQQIHEPSLVYGHTCVVLSETEPEESGARDPRLMTNTVTETGSEADALQNNQR